MICKVQGVKSFSMPENALSFLQIYFAVGQQGTLTLTLCPPHSYSLLFSPPPVWGCVVPPPITSPFPHDMHFSLIYFLFFPLLAAAPFLPFLPHAVWHRGSVCPLPKRSVSTYPWGHLRAVWEGWSLSWHQSWLFSGDGTVRIWFGTASCACATGAEVSSP